MRRRADAGERTPPILPQVPLAVGIMFSYGLSPVVDWLQLRRIPRALSSALLISSLLGGLGSAAYFLSDDASKLVETLPVATQKLRITLQSLRGKSDNTLDAMQKAAAQLEKAAEESGGSTPAIRGVQRVVIEKPKFSIRDYVWSGTLSLLAMLSQVGLVALFTFFLTPWLGSRTAKMSPVAVFVGVLAWGWLWGAWGLLLGVPILMVIKAVCDRTDGLKPVGELLSA